MTALLLVGIINIIVAPIKKARGIRRRDKIFQPTIDQNNQKMTYLENEIKRLADEIDKHYESCPNCPLGFKYTKKEYLATLYKYIELGEATTIKEAIHRLQLHMHQDQLERDAAETKMYAREAASDAAMARQYALEASVDAAAARSAANSAAYR